MKSRRAAAATDERRMIDFSPALFGLDTKLSTACKQTRHAVAVHSLYDMGRVPATRHLNPQY